MIFFGDIQPILPDLKSPQEAEQIRYMVPNPAISRAEEGTIVSNFKWEIERQSLLYDRRESVISEYLRLILHIVLGELRSSRYKVKGQRITINGIKLVATYPLAFGKDRHKSYVNVLSSFAERLREETGVAIDLEPPHLLNESYAGKSSVGDTGGGLELMADLGGGTTDIAFSADRELIFVDSIRYAGNYLFDLLTRDAYLPDRQMMEDRPLRDLTSVARKTRLQRIFRYKEPLEIWEGMYQPERLTKVKPLVNLFFEGLIWYLASLVGTYLKRNHKSAEQRLTVFLLGNGWNFIRASGKTPSDYVGEAIGMGISRLTGRSIEVNIPDVGKYGRAQNPKEATSIGALRCKEKDPGVFDGIQSIVGCKATIRIGNKATELNPDDLIPTALSGTGGERGMRCHGILDILPEEWKGEPLQFDEACIQILNQECITSVDYVGRNMKLRKSILSCFLEKVYLPRLAEVGG